ncbi:hypothetical protein LCD36_04725 [Saccharopolyspora sp. 6T]|uniref:hypothetical protein n=1 Tax=Saccharopolyspora sp. 6T TaxID=2877238 RepID=UPI001CD5DDE8|nr:hypothetical protein [Saccharopolyspora sp. 6T]MCA1185756.1 hypothetical protein [Saccharopolyspora sp. 6T]
MSDEISRALLRLADCQSVNVPAGLIVDLLTDCVDDEGEPDPTVLAIARLLNDNY